MRLSNIISTLLLLFVLFFFPLLGSKTHLDSCKLKEIKQKKFYVRKLCFTLQNTSDCEIIIILLFAVVLRQESLT